MEDQTQINTKLQKLQLSEDLEHALLQEFGKTDEDPLMSAHFDVNDYINQHFGTGTCLRD